MKTGNYIAKEKWFVATDIVLQANIGNTIEHMRSRKLLRRIGSINNNLKETEVLRGKMV